MVIELRILTEEGEVISLQDPVWDAVVDEYLDDQDTRYEDNKGGFRVVYDFKDNHVDMHTRVMTPAEKIRYIVRCYDDRMQVEVRVGRGASWTALM